MTSTFMLLEAVDVANGPTVLTPMLTPAGNLMSGSLEEVTHHLADLEKGPQSHMKPNYKIAEQNDALDTVPKLFSLAAMDEVRNRIAATMSLGSKPQINAANDGQTAKEVLLNAPPNRLPKPGLAA
jgi:hypothetical protein